MSSSPSRNARPPRTAAEMAPKKLDGFQRHIAEKLEKKMQGANQLPYVLWSSPFLLDTAVMQQLRERCKQLDLEWHPSLHKKILMQQLLNSPGEMEHIWRACGLPLEKLVLLCMRRFPFHGNDDLQAATYGQLIQMLADDDRQAIKDAKEWGNVAERAARLEDGVCQNHTSEHLSCRPGLASQVGSGMSPALFSSTGLLVLHSCFLVPVFILLFVYRR
eukprot:jgi/Mesvir1/1378/Mv21650-RA.1